jgi:cell division protein FtsZ
MINVDFADVRTVMSEMGHAMMGSGIAKGEDRAEEAAETAISSPLLEDIDLAGARGVLVNITAGLDMRLDEFETVGNTVKAFASDNATVVIGTSLDPDMTDEIRVTVVATGIGTERKPDITLVAGGKAKVAPTPQPQVAAQAAPKVEEKVAQPLQEKTEVKPQVKPQPTTSPVSSGTGASQSAAPKAEKESGYLDIPAFLRRQAD